jgi:hypothetical protein
MPKIHVIALTRGPSSKNLGDDNNARGTQRATFKKLEAKYSGYKVTSDPEINVRSAEDLERLQKQISDSGEDEYFAIIGAGTDCIEPLIALKKSATAQVFTTINSHQLSTELRENADQFDILSLPGHCPIPEGLKVLKTLGVPHNLQLEELEAERKKFSAEIPDAKKYTLVILGGDAPTENEKDPAAFTSEEKKRVKPYTKEEARLLGIHVGAQAIKTGNIVLAIDGPRTGQHNPATGNFTKLHEKTPEGVFARNEVSQAFIDGLRASGLSEGQFKFFDFKTGVVSAYKALLGAVAKQAGSTVFVPGESTSMISDLGILPNAKIIAEIIVYHNNAMNEIHQAHVDSVGRSGFATILKSSGEAFENVTPARDGAGSELKPELASETVAAGIANGISRLLTPATALSGGAATSVAGHAKSSTLST